MRRARQPLYDRPAIILLALLLATRAYATTPLVGFVPGVGVAYDVAVSGSRAYVATSAFGLSVVDVSTPASSVAVGATYPPFTATQVAVDGTLAALVGNSASVFIADISTDTPTVVGTLTVAGSTFKRVAISGSVVYVLRNTSGGSLLTTIDVSTPAAPAILGNANIAGLGGLAVSGTRAYVAALTAGLQIFDVTTPATPTLLTTTNTPGSATDVAVLGNYGYVADSSSLQVINITGTPAIVGALAVTTQKIAAVGTHAYIDNGTLFRVIDISTPSAPTAAGSISNFGDQGFTVSGNFAYLASAAVTEGLGGLYIIDVSNPALPAVVTNVDDRYTSTSVAQSGTLAVIAGGAGGMRVVDTATPTTPVIVARFAPASTTVQRVAMSGQYAYAIVTTASGAFLYVISLATPSAPMIVGQALLSGVGDLRIVGTTLYVADTTSGLRIYDVSNPFVPLQVSVTDTPGSARDVAVNGGYAYVADSSSVQIIDARNPVSPQIVGSVPVGAAHIANVGTHLFVLDGSSMRVILANNPAAPTVESTTAANAQGLAAYAARAFLSTPVTDHSKGVTVYTVTTPSSPTLLEEVITPGQTRANAVTAGTSYAGDSDATLDVIQVTSGAPANLCTCLGDADKNGFVNAADFGAVQVHFGQVANATSGLGDANCNGFVNSADFGVVASHFGVPCP